MDIVLFVVIMLLCLAVEAFFSGSEMALVNSDKYRLAVGTDKGSKLAHCALHLVKHPAQFFSTTLLGTNIAVVTASVVAAFFIIGRWGEAYAPLAILWWPVSLVFGEIVPKSIFQHHSDRLVLRVAPVLLSVSFALYPVVWLFSKLTDLLLGDIKKRTPSQMPVSREALEAILESSEAVSGDVLPAERTLISRIFDLADKKAAGIMTPIVDVTAISIGASREEAMRLLTDSGYSRVPVFDGKAFNVVGILAGMDMLYKEDASVKDVAKPAFYVPEEMPLDELLIEMKKRGELVAVAVDEYGAATGIISKEDLFEEIVGEIRDEHDERPAAFQRIGRSRYIVGGRMEVEEANARFNFGIPQGAYATVAGFVVHRMEKIPKEGDSFSSGEYLYTVRRATSRSVLEVEIARKPFEQ